MDIIAGDMTTPLYWNAAPSYKRGTKTKIEGILISHNIVGVPVDDHDVVTVS